MGSSNAELYLIDVSGFIFRAYHALPSLTTASGQPTGAAYGFANMLMKLLDDEKPSHVAAVMDTGRAAGFRRKLYPEYKANRPPAPDDLVTQFPLVEELLAGFRIPRLRVEGYEADDVIATLTRRARAQAMKVTIVSSDKDLMQLAGDGVRLLDTMKSKRFGRQEVHDKFGVWPEQLGDWLALVGDSSDNVPGVPGVGAKTATKLLAEHKDLDGVLAAVEQLRGKKLKENLTAHEAGLRLSRELVELAECSVEVELADLQLLEPDRRTLWKLFGALEFGRLRTRVGPGQVIDPTAHSVIRAADELADVVEQARRASEVALTLELSGARVSGSGLVGLSLCWGEGRAAYVPVSHVYLGVGRQLRVGEVAELIKPLLVDSGMCVLCDDSKALHALAAEWKIAMEASLVDISLGSYVLDPSRAEHDTAALARDVLGRELKPLGKGAIDEQPIEVLGSCSSERAEAVALIGADIRQRLAAERELLELLERIEQPLARVLARVESRGCLLDSDVLRALSLQLSDRLSVLERDVQEQAGWPVNINSPKQLQKLLFEQLGLSAGRKTKTGFSTDADVLADLALEHPIALQIEEFRTLSKLRSTYLDALPRLIDRKTGRVHTSFNQTVTATGRLSSSEPNLQNIPIRTDIGRQIREAFVASAGRVLLSADYSQVELRVLAHLSGDPVLVEAFLNEEDVHARTASEVFGVAFDEVTSEQRRVAKAVNFGVIYGQTDWGLARQLRIPQNLARQYIDNYFQRYAGVKAFMDKVIAEAKEQRVVRTLLGRRRPLADINARRYRDRTEAERMARNTPIQGTAADLLKLAMIRVFDCLVETELSAEMLLTVHDELVFEVDERDAEALAVLVREQMAGVHELAVPLVVDVGWGKSWAAAH